MFGSVPGWLLNSGIPMWSATGLGRTFGWILAGALVTAAILILVVALRARFTFVRRSKRPRRAAVRALHKVRPVRPAVNFR